MRRWLAALVGSLAGIAALACGAALLLDTRGLEEPLPGVGNVGLHELPDEEAWSVVILSDVQSGFIYLPEIFRRSAVYRPKAVLLLGDLSADHDEAHMRIPVWMMRRHPAPAPLFLVPGNHDVKMEKGRVEFLRWFGSPSFDFRIGRTRFLGENNADGPFDLAWLREKLAESSALGDRVVLCLHRPILDEPSYQELLDLLRAHRVSMVLTGHAHQPRDEIRDGTRFLIAPPSGDKGHDASQAPVSFLVLDRALDVHEERFFRSNARELEGTFFHLSLAHVEPFSRRRPVLFWTLLSLATALCLSGWIYFACTRT